MISLIVWLILLGDHHSSSDFTFTILHDGDQHGKFEETTRDSTVCPDHYRKHCVGGFGRIAHEVRKYRKWAKEGKGRGVLYLNAGDVYVGTTWFKLHSWNISAEMVNLLKPDVMTLGNHEFDLRVKELIPFVRKVNSPIVVANINMNKVPEMKEKITKSHVLTVNGHKIGIVGCLTEITPKVAYPEPVIILDMLSSVKEEMEKLNSQGIKIIILLSHVGFKHDQHFAKQLPLVDIIVGGHSHTLLYTGTAPDDDIVGGDYPFFVTQDNGKRVPIVHASAFTKYLGLLNVTFDDDGNLKSAQGQPIFLRNSIPQEKDILDVLDKYKASVQAVNNKVVGAIQNFLDARGRKCGSGECNMGNWVADAMVSFTASRSVSPFWTTHPIGLILSGLIRTSLNPEYRNGNITQGELISLYPFPDRLITGSMSGLYLREVLESVSNRRNIYQVSGLRIIYDLNKPIQKRIQSVKVRCGDCRVPVYEDLNDNKIYNIVTETFGSRYKKWRLSNKKSENIEFRDVLTWYLETHNPVMKDISGRITFIEKTSHCSRLPHISFYLYCFYTFLLFL